MDDERDPLEMTSVRVAVVLPVFDFSLAGFDPELSLQAGFTLWITSSTLLKALASLFQSPSGLPQPEANRRAVPFDQLMDEMKQVGHAQTPQSRFAQLD